MKIYDQQRGFGLIAIIVAVVIILIIAFGVGSWRGQIEQSKQIENKAVKDLQDINNNLIKQNLEIQKNLENNQ